MYRVIAVALVAACGRIGFDPIARLTDGAGGDAVAACTFGPWSAGQPVTELETTFNDWGGQITLDGLALYFNSDRTGNSEIFVATRPDRTSPFGAATQIVELGTPAGEGNPTVTGDQLEIYFDSSRGAGYALYSATRPDTASTWQNVTRADALYSGTDVYASYITPDGLTLYYDTGDSSTTTATMLVTTRATRGDAFVAGTPVQLIGATNGTPALSADQLTMYFEAGASAPKLDLFEATRPDVASPFGAATMLSFSTDGSLDADPSITADGLELFFASDRPDSIGAADLYVATRVCN